MNIINWFASTGASLLDGRWDLVTLGLAFVTLIYVGFALAISFKRDRVDRHTEALAGARVDSIKRMAERPFSHPASVA
jgi:hypothetical protein